MMDATDSSSTRPYLIRALYEWCTDNGFTPFIAVLVDDSVRVPNEYVKDGEIVLNISFDATSSLKLGNDFIEFKGRFGGVARDILVPVNRVLAIYARENGQGMAFPMLASSESGADAVAAPAEARPATLTSVASESAASDADTPPDTPPPDSPRPGAAGKPALKRVK
ncbi:MAG: ClpXP protease specificity-enhancing factor [Rhodoferax sp.]